MMLALMVVFRPEGSAHYRGLYTEVATKDTPSRLYSNQHLALESAWRTAGTVPYNLDAV